MYCCPGGCDTTFPVSEHFQPAGTKERDSYVTWVCILEEGGGGGVCHAKGYILCSGQLVIDGAIIG